MLSLAFLAIIAAVLGPHLVIPDRSVPGREAECLRNLAAAASGAASRNARCPACDLPYAIATLAGQQVLACPDPQRHLGPEPPRFVRRHGGAWTPEQALPETPALEASPRAVATGGLARVTTASADSERVVLDTRPHLLLRILLAPCLLVLSFLCVAAFVREGYSGWRPGGTPSPPGAIGLALLVGGLTLVNPPTLLGLALLLVRDHIEIPRGGTGPLTRAQLGNPASLGKPLLVAAVPQGEERWRVVVVARADSGEIATHGLLTVERGDLGLVRALAEAPRGPAGGR